MIAERAGDARLASAAAEEAAILGGASIDAAHLTDRMRAARLQSHESGAASANSLWPLLDPKGLPFSRPADADDTLWSEYTLLLADLAARAGKPDLARAGLAAMPGSALQNWRTAAQVAQIALQIGQPHRALQVLRRWDAKSLAAAGADKAQQVTVLLLKARAAQETGEVALEGASAAEAEAIDERASGPLDRAQRLLDAEDPHGAATLLEAAEPKAEEEAAATSGPAHAAAEHRLARLLVTLGEARRRAGLLATAAQAFERGLAIEESWPARWSLADTLRRLGRQQDAAMQLRRLATTAPTPAQAQTAWLTLGDLLWAQGAIEPAFEAFQSAVAAGAGRSARLRMAEAAERLGRTADEVRALGPIAYEAVWKERLCRAFLAANQPAQAKACLEQMVAGAGRDARTWRSAAGIAQALGDTEDQARYLETAWRLSHGTAEGLNAGYVLLRAGRTDEAAGVFREVSDGSGTRAPALRSERRCSACISQLLRQRFCVRHWPPPGCRQTLQAQASAALGYALDAEGDPAGAAAAWERSLALRPSPGIALARIDGLLRSGHPVEATTALAAFDRSQPTLTPEQRELREDIAIRLESVGGPGRGGATQGRGAGEPLSHTQPARHTGPGSRGQRGQEGRCGSR